MPPYIYTALIDVLSYRQRLKQDINTGQLLFKTDLESALSAFDSINSALFGVQAISDTIIMTCNSHENFPEFLSILQNIFISFLDRGLYIRGGIAYSRHFQNGRVTYSHAIARAYELESEAAIYPRIVIDKNIVDMYRSGTGLPSIFGNHLLAMQNGVTFLNIINNDNWSDIYSKASLAYTRDADSLVANESAFAKHQWFENYIFACKPLGIDGERYISPITLI